MTRFIIKPTRYRRRFLELSVHGRDCRCAQHMRELKAHIKELYETTDMTVTEIGRAVGKHPNTVNEHLKRMGKKR